jgi:hypothetical protein
LVQLYEAVILPALTIAEQDRHKGALDPRREEFLFLSVREMLMEFSEKAQNPYPEHSVSRLESAVAGRILCFPAHDEADEIAAGMLAQVLERAGRATVSFPAGSFPQSMLGMIEPTANDVFCISAIPPFAFSHASTLCRQLRAKCPETKILIGVWGFGGEIERALKRFQPSPPDKLVSSFADALDYLGVCTQAAKAEGTE